MKTIGENSLKSLLPEPLKNKPLQVAKSLKRSSLFSVKTTPKSKLTVLKMIKRMMKSLQIQNAGAEKA